MGVDPGMALNKKTTEGGVDKAIGFIQERRRSIQGNEFSTAQAPPSSLTPVDPTRAHWPYVCLTYIYSDTRLVGFGFLGILGKELPGLVSTFFSMGRDVFSLT